MPAYQALNQDDLSTRSDSESRLIIEEQRHKLSREAAAQVIQPEQMQKGFLTIVAAVDDLQIDVPDAPDLVANFVARAVVDDILPPAFVDKLPPGMLACSPACDLPRASMSPLALASYVYNMPGNRTSAQLVLMIDTMVSPCILGTDRRSASIRPGSIAQHSSSSI